MIEINHPLLGRVAVDEKLLADITDLLGFGSRYEPPPVELNLSMMFPYKIVKPADVVKISMDLSFDEDDMTIIKKMSEQWIGPFATVNPFNKKTRATFKTRHRKWPLGTKVIANTPIGRIEGKVGKHWRDYEVAAGCTVDFHPHLIDLGDANGERFCHVIPFRNLKKIKP